MTLRLHCLSLVVAVSICGCHQDFQDVADRHVERDILDKHEKREAIAFLESNGHFFDDDEEEVDEEVDEATPQTSVDRDVVLPLLKRLNELSYTEQWAMIRPEKTDSAYGMLVRLPSDAGTVDRMAQAVQEADDKFPGFILQQWGHDWLLFDLIDQETYEFLKKNDPDIDIQR